MKTCGILRYGWFALTAAPKLLRLSVACLGGRSRCHTPGEESRENSLTCPLCASHAIVTSPRVATPPHLSSKEPYTNDAATAHLT